VRPVASIDAPFSQEEDIVETVVSEEESPMFIGVFSCFEDPLMVITPPRIGGAPPSIV
jgi:hypothetical protein